MVLHSLRVFQQFREITGGDAGYVQCGALLAVGPGQRDALATDGGGAARARHRHAADRRPTTSATLDPRIDPFAVGRGGLGAGVGLRRSDRRDGRLRPGGRARRRRHRAGRRGRRPGRRRRPDRGGAPRERRADRRAGRRERRRPLVPRGRPAGRRDAADHRGPPPGLRRPARAGLRPPASRVPRSRERDVPPPGDRRPHAHRLPRRGRAEPSDGPRGARRRRRVRRGGPDHGAGQPLRPGAGGGALPARLRRRLRHHPGLDAGPRRDVGPRPLRRRRHVRPRLQALPGGGPDDGRPHHARGLRPGRPPRLPARPLHGRAARRTAAPSPTRTFASSCRRAPIGPRPADGPPRDVSGGRAVGGRVARMRVDFVAVVAAARFT